MSKSPDLLAQHSFDILLQEKHELTATILNAQLMAGKLTKTQEKTVLTLISIAEARLFDVRRSLENLKAK